MVDFKLIARILAAILACEDEATFDCALIDERVLKTTAVHRDNLVLKLRASGYVDGLCVIDGIDNNDKPVIIWGNSKPTVTLSGMEYLQTCQPLRKAIDELKAAGLSIAGQVVANKIFNI